MTTIPQRIWNALTEDEKKVQEVFAEIVAGAEVGLKDLEAGIGWVEDNAGAIIGKIQQIEGFVIQLEVAANPQVAGIMIAANAAMDALNAAVASRATGKTTPQQLLDAYQAYTAADAAVAQAKAAAAIAPAAVIATSKVTP